MGTVVNTQGVAAGFSPVKVADWYDAILTGVSYKENAGEKQLPMTTLEFTLDDPREDGHKCWRNLSHSTDSLPYMKGAAIKLGVEPSVVEGAWDPEEVFKGQIGTKCKLRITLQPYQGDIKDNVARIEARDFDPAAAIAEATGKKAPASSGGWG